MEEVIIIGAGGHGKVIADIITACGDKVIGFLDDNVEGNYYGNNIIGNISDVPKFMDSEFVIAVGDNDIRENIAEKNKVKWYTAIHPTAIISPTVKIGEGTVVMANSVINASSTIGKHCIINTAAVVEHDNYIGNYSHISPNAILAGTVILGRKVHIGASAVLINNINVSDNIIIGAGAVVVKNIDTAGTYVGTPVRKIK